MLVDTMVHGHVQGGRVQDGRVEDGRVEDGPGLYDVYQDRLKTQ